MTPSNFSNRLNSKPSPSRREGKLQEWACHTRKLFETAGCQRLRSAPPGQGPEKVWAITGVRENGNGEIKRIESSSLHLLLKVVAVMTRDDFAL